MRYYPQYYIAKALSFSEFITKVVQGGVTILNILTISQVGIRISGLILKKNIFRHTNFQENEI